MIVMDVTTGARDGYCEHWSGTTAVTPDFSRLSARVAEREAYLEEAKRKEEGAK